MDANDIRSRMERHAGFYPQTLTDKALREAGCMSTVCALPEDINERARFLANVLVQMMGMPKTDDTLKPIVGQLCQALSYMVNSASWRDGELHEFDRLELKRKLARFGDR